MYLLLIQKVRFYFYKLSFQLYFNGFHEKLGYLTFVSLRPFFVKNNFVSLGIAVFYAKYFAISSIRLSCLTENGHLLSQ